MQPPSEFLDPTSPSYLANTTTDSFAPSPSSHSRTPTAELKKTFSLATSTRLTSLDTLRLPSPPSSLLVVSVGCILVISGSLVVMFLQAMNLTKVHRLCTSSTPPTFFESPALQVFYSRFAELLAGGIGMIIQASVRWCRRRSDDEGEVFVDSEPSCSPLWIILVAVLSVFGDLLCGIGLLFCGASVYTFFVSGGLVTCVSSAILLVLVGRILFPHHLLALSFIITGTCFTSIWCDRFDIDDVRSSFYYWGLHGPTFDGPLGLNEGVAGLICLGFYSWFGAVRGLIEERLLQRFPDSHGKRKRMMDVSRFIFWNGFWGIGLTAIVIFPIFFKWEEAQAYAPLEKLDCDLLEVFLNPTFALWVVLFLIAQGFYSFSMRWLVASIGATATSVIDSWRSITVWLLQMMLKIEDWDGIQNAGIFFLMFGLLLFARFVRIGGIWPGCKKGTYDRWFRKTVIRRGFYCAFGLDGVVLPMLKRWLYSERENEEPIWESESGGGYTSSDLCSSGQINYVVSEETDSRRTMTTNGSGVGGFSIHTSDFSSSEDSSV